MIALPCPVCGKPLPPPVSKGGRPRKYCSLKCASVAGYEHRKESGYRRPKTHMHVCPVCGETFYSERAKATCCSVSCGRAYSASLKAGKEPKLKLSARQQMKARLAQRDAAWEASPYAAPVTVEERGNRVIETRGQRCIGFAAVSCVKHC